MTKNTTIAPIYSTTPTPSSRTTKITTMIISPPERSTENPILENDDDSTKKQEESSTGGVSRFPQSYSEGQTVDASLRVGIRESDIYPIVEVKLSRKQDQSNQKRVQIAEQVASSLRRSLATNFHGQELTSKFILLTRITIVSDGSSTARALLGKTATSGHAKLTISYSLISSGEENNTTKVALSERICLTTADQQGQSEQQRFGRNNGTRLVMGMAEKCARKIPCDVMASIRQHPVPRRTYDWELLPTNARITKAGRSS